MELAGRDEAAVLEALGLGIDDADPAGALLSQPCRALRGRRCRIYADRPECCRTFECRLLRQVRCGAVGVGRAGERIAEARTRIGRVSELLARLGRRDSRLPLGERCAEALAVTASADPEENWLRAELEAAMSAVEKWTRWTFLDESG